MTGCYYCGEPASTTCDGCGEPICVEHDAGAPEGMPLLCNECAEDVEAAGEL